MIDYDPTDIKGQELKRAEQQRRMASFEGEEKDDLKWLMSQKRGRRIVWKLLDRAGVFRVSFNTNSMTMAFNEGRKNEGLRILALIHDVVPDLYPVMIKEQHE